MWSPKYCFPFYFHTLPHFWSSLNNDKDICTGIWRYAGKHHFLAVSSKILHMTAFNIWCHLATHFLHINTFITRYVIINVQCSQNVVPKTLTKALFCRVQMMQQAYRCAWKFQSDWLDYSSHNHYGDVTMGVIAYQSTSLTIVYSSVYSDADQRKRHQSSAALNSPHKWRVTRKMFPFDDVIMIIDHFCKIFSCDVFSDVKPDRWFYTRYMNEPLCLFSRNC